MRLKNRRHEHFARAIASGENGTNAYRKVYGDHISGAKQIASELMQRPEVSSRVDELMEMSETEHVLSMQERREFIARVVRADLTNLDFEEDGDLVQEVTRTEGTRERAGIEKFKLPGKLESIMADARLSGELLDKPQNINVGVAVNITIPEDQRSKLMEKRRQADERLREMKQAKAKEIEGGKSES